MLTLPDLYFSPSIATTEFSLKPHTIAQSLCWTLLALPSLLPYASLTLLHLLPCKADAGYVRTPSWNCSCCSPNCTSHSHDTAVKFFKLSEALREWPSARQFGMHCQQEEGEGKGQMTAVEAAWPASNSRIIGIYNKPITKCR